MSETGTEPRPRSRQVPDPVTAENVTYDPTMAQLRELAAPTGTETEYDSLAFVSEYRSRSADRTRNAVDHDFDEDDRAILDAAVEATRDGEWLCLDRQVGRHPEASFCCRYYVPVEYARIALSWATLFEPTDIEDPDFVTVQDPRQDEVAIRILPEEGFTAVLGSDYTGEAKKSFLRLFMYHVKQRGGLGLHAGSKIVRLFEDEAGASAADASDDGTASGGASDVTGELASDAASDATSAPTEIAQLFLGLSATGKSTLTAHGLWLEDPEEAVMVQDDVVALLRDGAVAGSEGNGLYIKTYKLSAELQPDLHHAATDETAVLENVAVDPDGTVDFYDGETYTKNGRASIRRSCLESATEGIDVDHVDQIFFITRHPLMPPIAKLDDAQAAAAFMLGESIETSAGDPERAGEAIRVVGTNPFIVGSEGAEGNRFQDLVADLDVDCFVINTGYVGEESHDVGVTETVTILTEVARGTVDWIRDERLHLTVPVHVPGLDIDAYYPPAIVENYDEAAAALRAERKEYLRTFPDLRAEIVRAAY